MKSEMSLSLTDLRGRSPGVSCAKPLRAKTEVHPPRARGQLQTQRREVVRVRFVFRSRFTPSTTAGMPRDAPPLTSTPRGHVLQAPCLPPAGGRRTQGEGTVGLPALPSPPAPSVSEDVAADAGTFRVRRGRTGCLREGHCLLSASQSCQWPTCSTVQPHAFQPLP